MNRRQTQRRTRIVQTAGIACLVAIALLSLTAPALAVQETDSTATATATATDACSSDGDVSLQQTRLIAEEETASEESPGRLVGGFQPSPTAGCPVVVNVTLRPDSGLSLAGGENFTRTDDGDLTIQMTLEPGEMREISVTVDGDASGERAVTGDVRYWPRGQPEESKQMNGLSVLFTAGSASTETVTTVRTTNGSGPLLSPSVLLVGAVLVLVAGAASRRP